MKIELDLPDEMVKDLRDKSLARGLSVVDYTTELVREVLRQTDDLTPAQRRTIDARLAEGLEDIKQGRVHGPFSTHAELRACLHGKTKKKRSKRTPG